MTINTIAYYRVSRKVLSSANNCINRCILRLISYFFMYLSTSYPHLTKQFESQFLDSNGMRIYSNKIDNF